MSDGYEVGYGKPPKTGQWQAGKSGNPAGSSKKSKAPSCPIITLKHDVARLKSGTPEQWWVADGK